VLPTEWPRLTAWEQEYLLDHTIEAVRREAERVNELF
jgi:hypothetical protein